VTTKAERKPLLRTLTGCTGVGKTEFAVRWAETHGAEIISCDSLLFYRGMNIGTAKPTPEEQGRVRHHLIDCCELTEQMDVMQFVAMVKTAIADITSRGLSVLIVGGSGFYLRSFLGPVADDVKVPSSIRDEVRALTAERALEQLRALNPDGLGALDVANPRRVARALERCHASGRTLRSLANAFARQPSPFGDWQVELTRLEREPAELGARIVARVDAMLRAGLVEEVRSLLDHGLKENPSAARAIGYREVIAMLAGTLAPEALAHEIVKNTRQLVKKQRTWFRTQLPTHRVVTAAELAAGENLFLETAD
jgi:tRNA dimethylallyltransferase